MEEREQDKRQLKKLLVQAGVVIFAFCCIILFYFCVERYQGLGEGWDTFIGVWMSIIFGFALAFLMNPIMKFLERRMLPFFLKHAKTEKSGKKTSRMICSIVSLVIVMGIIILFLVFVIPEMISTIKFLITHLSEQIDGVLDWANMITGGRFKKQIMAAKGSDINKGIREGLSWLETHMDIDIKDLVPVVATGAISVVKFIVNILIGMIVSVYILCSKEIFKGQAKKLLYGIFRADYANVIMEVYRKAMDIFYGFLIGKLIDSFIIGVICYVCMLIFGMPYPLLVSVIVGVTNIIPVFGPYIGAVPTVIIIFLTEPMQGIYFLIFVIILQQIDGNIIGPKILGDSTGLSSFWVVVAIVVGGGLFGFPGMLFGVPTTALLYYLVGRFARHLLRKKNLPEDTKSYINLERVDVTTNTLVEHPAAYQDRKRMSLFQKSKESKVTEEEKK